MKVKETEIKGLLILEPQIFEDTRGYFYESFNKKIFTEHGIDNDFVQDNQSKSAHGVLRGLHYQLNPYAQAKLVRVLSGEVLDIAVDIRKGSPTYLHWHAERLSAENKRQIFVPRGFAHGFIVLSDSAEFFYKCDNFYSKGHEAGIKYDDPDLSIDWQLDANHINLSEKDNLLPYLKEAKNNFTF